jgi:hypothetical protein
VCACERNGPCVYPLCIRREQGASRETAAGPEAGSYDHLEDGTGTPG